jgi:hypothetical protein
MALADVCYCDPFFDGGHEAFERGHYSTTGPTDEGGGYGVRCTAPFASSILPKGPRLVDSVRLMLLNCRWLSTLFSLHSTVHAMLPATFYPRRS